MERLYLLESRILQDDWSASNKICILDVLNVPPLDAMCEKESDIALLSIVLHRKNTPRHQFLEPSPSILLQPVTNCQSISPSVRFSTNMTYHVVRCQPINWVF